jgi:uncharacterized membrane protein YoaK (UPF0700 family)
VAPADLEPLEPIAGTLALAASLAAVAGSLDAVSLDRLTGTFVAFQSGNTVLMGLEIGQGHFARVWPLLFAVLTYIAGSALTPFVIRAGSGIIGAPRRLLVGATGLMAVDAVIVLVGVGTGTERPTGVLRYLGIIAATLAMAMQTPVVRRVQGVVVSSTFSSGMLVRLGQSLGELIHPGARTRERSVAKILGITNAAFLGGAIVGGIAIDTWGNLAILVPAFALAVVAFARERYATAT